MLDFTGTNESLGKPAETDLTLGLATAPVLFACEQFPELKELVQRRFAQPGDILMVYISECHCVDMCS